MDVQSNLWTLARRLVPLHVLKEKLDIYVREGHIEEEDKDDYVEVFEKMVNIHRQSNLFGNTSGADAGSTDPDEENRFMSMAELQEELQSREHLMQMLRGEEGQLTDQWRVYQEIISKLDSSRDALRMVVQASAGTGKSFLLETVFMWCILKGHDVQAAAPTGIAAARLRVRKTKVKAATLHYVFALTVEMESKLDASNLDDEATQRLAKMTLLILDEASMIDEPTWRAIRDQLSSIGAASAETAGELHPQEDIFGRCHILIAVDLKQLPPATAMPFFLTDPEVVEHFEFRTLQQNRRLNKGKSQEEQEDLDAFHQTLEDVAHGRDTALVREALLQAYVRGAHRTQSTVSFEGSTACVTKRRYRDRWNGKVLTRISARYKRLLRVKSVFLNRGSKDQWVRDSAAREIRRCVRSQCLSTFRMAGQWLDDPPVQGEDRPHCMRAMLVANTDVQNAFANGATGRIVRWSPEFSPTDKPMKRCLANNPDLQATFYQEDSYQSSKKHFLPEVDFMHIEPKKEVVAGARGKPSMLQLPFQPAYCLTIHKVQALTLRHVVDGCLEGMFALGQLYVLWSRVTDPKLFCAVGLPPADMLDDVAKAWRDDGQDVDSCFSEAVKVTGEWTYMPAAEGEDPCENVLSRLEPVHAEARRVPLRLSELRQILNPQPKAADVVHALLSWIHRADAASQAQESKPAFQREDGSAIFPPEELWWLTEFEKRKPCEDNVGDLSGEVVPDEDLTRNPNEAGAADFTDESSMSEDEDFSGYIY